MHKNWPTHKMPKNGTGTEKRRLRKDPNRGKYALKTVWFREKDLTTFILQINNNNNHLLNKYTG